MKPYAVIDLGTNTFHLLIAEVDTSGTIKVVERKREFVKLGEGGVAQIIPAAFQRGMDTLKQFKTILDQYEVQALLAFGTAALRTASNGQDFIQQVKADTGIHIQLISGDREAALIQRGVALAVPFDDRPQLIMDIGGGSVEFIIADRKEVFWAHSFPIGVAVLFARFHQHDPITAAEIKDLDTFLRDILQPLEKQLKKYPVLCLAGASGTFDVMEAILVHEKSGAHYSTIPTSQFLPFYKQVIGTTLEERLAIDGVPAPRAEMLIVAIQLILTVLSFSNFETIYVSSYAMKEGMLVEMMEQRVRE